MELFKDECTAKSLTINKLQKRIGELESKLSAQTKEIALHIKAKQQSDDQLSPVRSALNKMTAEYGKLLRKVKRNNSK